MIRYRVEARDFEHRILVDSDEVCHRDTAGLVARSMRERYPYCTVRITETGDNNE